MKHPGPVTLLPLLLLLQASPPVAAEAAAGTADPLWRKAVELVGANDSWTAGSAELTGEERDGRGRTRSTWAVRTRTAPGPDGEGVQEILSYVENGKDITAEKRADQGSGRGGGGRGGFNWNPADPRETPFHPLNQDGVTIRRLETPELLEGRPCVAYVFTQKIGTRERAVGTAWLDAATGAPLRVRGTVDPLPLFVHGGDVDVRYELAPDGSWTVRRFHLLGEITIVLVRRTFVMDITMADHWRP